MGYISASSVFSKIWDMASHMWKYTDQTTHLGTGPCFNGRRQNWQKLPWIPIDLEQIRRQQEIANVNAALDGLASDIARQIDEETYNTLVGKF